LNQFDQNRRWSDFGCPLASSETTLNTLGSGQIEMNTYKSLVKLVVTQRVTTTTNVVVQAQDAYKAKLQLEAMYGKGNVVSYPQLVR
jgi:hypothetical protein